MSFIIKLIVVLVSVFVFLKLVALYTNSSKKIAKKSSKARLLVAGFLANFADTLGLGSFAVVVAFNNRWNLVEDKKLPGTLNAHCVLPAMLQSLLFLNFVEMDIFLLITFVLAVCGGGLLSGFLVAKLETQTIRFLMCIGFVGIGILIIASQLHLLPVGGEATFLPMEK